MRYGMVSFLFIPHLLWAQLKSEKNFTSLPMLIELNDTLVYQPEITWAIAIKNYIDVLQLGVQIRQTFEGTLSQHLMKAVLEKKLTAYPFFQHEDNGKLRPLILEDGVLYEPVNPKSLLFDSGKPDSGYGYGLDRDLRHFYFTQYIYWNDRDKKLTSKIIWAGIAKEYPDNTAKTGVAPVSLIRVPVTTSEKNDGKKPIWSADNYFEQSLPDETDNLLLKKMFDMDLAWLIWPSIDSGQVIIKDTNGTQPLDYDSLRLRICRAGDTLNVLDPVTGEERLVITSPELNPNDLKYFGVLQYIVIYDDWAMSVEIKGLKLFFSPEPEQTPRAAGWIYFK